MNPIADIAGALLRAGAPLVGGLLQTVATTAGGPLVGAATGAILGTLAEALGLPADAKPEEVAKQMKADPDAAAKAAAKAEDEHGEAADELTAILEDRQDARRQTVELAKEGSAIAWGAPVVSAVVLVSFAALSLLAMKPELTGVRTDVVLYLLGAWQSLAAGVVGYWVGSSKSSHNKDALLAGMITSRAPAAPMVRKK